jgi:oxygen-independent coproporphyrinogen-3 oxidase
MSATLHDEVPDEVTRIASRPPRSAYIHVPFCRHHCGYCNFTLVAGRDDLIGDYLRAVEIELRSLAQPREVDTLYFGGGTPTHLSPTQFRELASIVLNWHPLAAGYEWTVEANPADVNSTMIKTLAELGVNRLSLGSQSFQSDKLRLLERDHNPADIRTSVELARAAGMQVSLDLIFAAPGETLANWRSDLETAMALEPDHISTYGLTFEQGTPFWNHKMRGALTEIDEELQRDMYALAIDQLSSAGYEHYEVSSFAHAGRRSRHNQVYWSGDGYYAAGPGAARYVDGVRETNLRSTTAYLKNILAHESATAERETLSPEARARELLVLSLRRLEGISRASFREKSGYEVNVLVDATLKKFADLGLLRDDGEQIQLTREGLFVCDAIWPEML